MVREVLILKRNRIFFTPNSKMKEKVLGTLHNIPLASHIGITNTYKVVRERFTWKGLEQDILRHV